MAEIPREGLRELPSEQERVIVERLGPDWHQHDAFMVMTNSALTSSVEEITADRWRIYCLTPHSESLLRWAHYADKHSGICFEFDATQEPFARAYQVLYNEALVALGPDIFDDPRGMADGVLLSKSSKWEYEDAHTRTRSFQRSGISITTDGDFLPLPETTLTAIIAGCSADMNAILPLVKDYAPVSGEQSECHINTRSRLSNLILYQPRLE